ncbi:MAG TPA: tetraprenyl-beta-curcumene synthase family protein [Bacilli bacterium]
MYRVYRYILPEVRSQLGIWRGIAETIPDPELKAQAIASMATKQFHCEGGAIYAAANLQQKNVLIPLIVAFQTISDYLDNLCDRSTSLDAQDFRQLHQAMLDAVDPSSTLKDYYLYHDEKDDGGYLSQLVKTCQSCICLLPSFHLVQSNVRELVSLYCDLQVYKHIRRDLREGELLEWWERYRARYSQLYWNEFAAATGSTLAVFMLFLSASDKHLEPSVVNVIREAYFPHICSLHILLDYLIDQEEDRLGGDLNFCNYYNETEITLERIKFIVDQARKDIGRLPHSAFHRMIIEGLLALYLSDPKVREQQQVRQISKQLMKKSPLTRIFFWMNSVWIRKLM